MVYIRSDNLYIQMSKEPMPAATNWIAIELYVYNN